MYRITILLITILIPTVQSSRPTTRLTFSPDEKFMSSHQQVEIQCDLLDPTNEGDIAQLWYVDLVTGQRTAVSRKLLTKALPEDPNIFKNNKNSRYLYRGRNHILIRSLQPEDSARYECDCPDCADTVIVANRNLYVMKLAAPTWIMEQGWPLHESTKTTIKCQVDDFFPYTTHKILRNQQDITHMGSSSLVNNNSYPQKFTWEATVTPISDWHNSTFHCIVTEGNVVQNTSKLVEVLFAPRFNKCDENQYVDLKKNFSTIECSYSGNPQPTLFWLRQSDKKRITADIGITIEVKNDANGKYRSIVTFDQQKLINLSSTPKPNGQGNKTEANYYQQLLSDGFIAQLNVNGNDKAKRIIKIIRDANQMRSMMSNRSTKISYSSILSLSFLLILYMIRR